MKKWILILSGLLAAQLVLAAVLNLTGEDHGAFQAVEKLLSFDRQAVVELRIEDPTDSVVLKKQSGKWLLPESGDFPASQSNVERLLDKLAVLEKGWPVATSRSAARRFMVDEEQFERKLALLTDDDTRATLFVGSSPGFRKVYVRPGDAHEVFAVEFDSWESEAKADHWIDKNILALDEANVERVEIPGVVLRREDGELQVANPGQKEQSDGVAIRALLGRLTEMSIQSLLGSDARPEYRQDKPVLEIKMTRTDGDVLSYRFSKPEDAAYYVLKRSDLDHYFKVAEYTVNPIRETTREKLLQARTDNVSREPVGDQRDSEDDDASADDQTESAAGGESTKEDQ
jgi:hypothetical protein